MTKPSENLVGLTLSDEWVIKSMRAKMPKGSGGNFSTGYNVVDSNGNSGFLKAIDLSDALTSSDVLQALSVLLDAVNHERQILAECREKRFDRIATSIHEETIPMGHNGFSVPVPCFIFDAALSDVRDFLNLQKSLSHSRICFMMHQASLGLSQLHSIKVAHQDLKPSNVLVFANRDMKIADLGRSSKAGKSTALDEQPVAGDTGYSPPELLYGRRLPDWNDRRLSTDLYMLGGLLTYFLTQQSMTSLVFSRLDSGLWPGKCDFDTVLPAWRHHFGVILNEIEDELRPELDSRTLSGLMNTLNYLCEPDPELRGHPLERSENQNQHDLRRFVSEFEFLSRRIDLLTVNGV